MCLFWISKQWGDLDQLLPAYLERQFGSSTPIYSIHSLNTWVCMLGPSIAAALTEAAQRWTPRAARAVRTKQHARRLSKRHEYLEDRQHAELRERTRNSRPTGWHLRACCRTESSAEKTD